MEQYTHLSLLEFGCWTKDWHGWKMSLLLKLKRIEEKKRLNVVECCRVKKQELNFYCLVGEVVD